jgi:predicted lipoprotein with Yx(FWY)xxD motif
MALTLLIAAASARAARNPVLTIKAAHNASVNETIVVTSSGRTLYRLKPETTRHFLCTSSKCKRIWRPLTVRSRRTTLKKGPGVSGTLRIVRRPDGKLQVTFRGLPLYTYSGDRRAGDANGQSIHSFGGTWLVVRAGTSPSSPPSSSTPPSPPPYSPPSSSPPPYSPPPSGPGLPYPTY